MTWPQARGTWSPRSWKRQEEPPLRPRPHVDLRRCSPDGERINFHSLRSAVSCYALLLPTPPPAPRSPRQLTRQLGGQCALGRSQGWGGHGVHQHGDGGSGREAPEQPWGWGWGTGSQVGGRAWEEGAGADGGKWAPPGAGNKETDSPRSLWKDQPCGRQTPGFWNCKIINGCYFM